MLDLPHGFAALVLLGVQKQLGEVVDDHDQHPGAGIEVLLGVDLQVVVVDEIEDVHRLRLAVGADDIKVIHPAPDGDVLPLRGHLPQQVHLGHQLGDIFAEGVLPAQHMAAALVVAPEHLPVFPQDHGGHGELRHRVPLGPEEGLPEGHQLPVGIPGDARAAEQGPEGHQRPQQSQDQEQLGIHKKIGRAGYQGTEHQQSINHRAVKIHTVQHRCLPSLFPEVYWTIV